MNIKSQWYSLYFNVVRRINTKLLYRFIQCSKYKWKKHFNNQNYTKDERIIYFARDIEEFYVFGDENINLKDYITDSDQTLDNSINSIIEKFDKIYELDDGGTAVYKSKDTEIVFLFCFINSNIRILIWKCYICNDCLVVNDVTPK